MADVQPADTAEVARRAGRVVVVDESGALLLLRGCDPAEPGRGAWWFTPGGGLDAGESYEAAARRELYEETGLAVEALGPVVHRRTTVFWFEGVRYRQRERFFSLRTRRFEPVDAHRSDVERRSVLGHGWWTRAELAATADVVYPRELAAILAGVLAAAQPASGGTGRGGGVPT